ncbi:outer membrane transport energization protein ExbD [Chitinophaga sp. YR573]|uniref:biopolymer transporter ExbD n=1 Tax=Chitinophaga sp. YR573 TaxID=1881040 RepID=UPI0008CDE502|nr:biopolymer transporter ExbD [Chitinophaga sp. YR573]SEW13561.1 outer membrane transport energization protein ExbD [Chitinophaga sp. YR573]
MAEMNTGSTQNSHKGGIRSKKLSTRVDMTPMVDLGFLLITFFMLTTTLTKPKVMDLIMPRNDGDPSAIADSKALTILLGANDKVSYYAGMGNDLQHPPKIMNSRFANTNGIRDIILAKRTEVLKRFGKNDLMVLIKADNDANYRNVVDIMDEMLISDISRYAMVDITPEEKAFLKSSF